jgi:hypothetical protein
MDLFGFTPVFFDFYRWLRVSFLHSKRSIALMHDQGITMNRIDLWKLLLLVLPLSLTLSVNALAHDTPEGGETPEVKAEEVSEEASDDEEESEADEEEEEEKPKTIAELTEEMDRIDGLFTLFRDPKTGATKMLL